MERARVQATYSAPPLFLLSDNWLQIRDILAAQFPLRNITWKPSLRPFTRNIEQLDVSFVALEDVKENRASILTGSNTLLERPLLNIFVVACDDLDSYKSTVKSQLLDWHSKVSPRKYQDWIIILVSRPDHRDGGGTLRKVKGNLFSKIKSDFNADKREHCIQVFWSPGHRDNVPAIWEECGSLIKASLLRTFEDMISQREEEVKRSESQRQMPGWSFCGFFLAKESLATSFDAMGLLEDALLLYDELEASLFQVLKERSLSWFGRLIDPDSSTDSTSIFSLSQKPYRHMVLSSSISVFDCRVYLLAHQCDLLKRMGNILEITRRARTFLCTFPQTLRQAESSLARFFIESWVYTAAMEASNLCDTLSSSQAESQRKPIHAAQAELLDLAISQLDAIGIGIGFLPNQLPFSFQSLGGGSSMQVSENLPNDNQKMLTNKELVSAMNGWDGFVQLYRSVTSKTVARYKSAGRRRFAVKLEDKLTSIERFPLGTPTPRSSPLKSTWPLIEAYTSSKSALRSATSEELPSGTFGELLGLCSAAVDDEDTARLLSHMNSTDVPALLERTIHGAPPEGHVLNNSPGFRVRILTKTIRLSLEQPGTCIDIELISEYPIPLRANALDLQFLGAHEMRLSYSSGPCEIRPGKQIITVSCSISSEGLHYLTCWSLSFGKLIFESTQDMLRRDEVPEREKSLLIDIPKDRRALHLEVKPPDKVELLGDKQLCFSIRSGQYLVTSLEVAILGPPSIRFMHNLATYEPEGERIDLISESKLSLKPMEPETAIDFSVPYTGGSSNLVIGALLQYRTDGNPSRIQVAHFSKTLDTSLPIQIRVHDIFRDQTLFCALSIHSTTSHLVRLASVDLLAPKTAAGGYLLSGSGIDRQEFITDQVSTTRVFKIDRLNTEDVSRNLVLRVKLRTLREEITELINLVSDKVANYYPNGTSSRRLGSEIVMNSLSRSASWILGYQHSGVLVVPTLDETEDPQVRAFAEQVVDELRNSTPYAIEKWRTVDMPLEIPFMTVVAEVELIIREPENSSHQRHPFAGSSLQATCCIQTTFRWGGIPVTCCEMSYEVEEAREDWIISGQRKGVFFAQDGKQIRIPLTLIPVHHGVLSLPRIQVSPCTSSASLTPPSCVCLQRDGASRLLILPRHSRTTFLLDLEAQLGDLSE